ncbi:MAG: inositol monophosphatase family protein [Desulfobacterales bacterium]|jgi:myo-inositol-1(or 4)-monophosphatase
MDLEKVKRVGIAAAYQGAEILRSRFGRISQVDKKGAIDLVTEADIGSEEKIVSVIQTTFPDHTILAEESGLSKTTSEYKWLIDPLDGTTNFAHQVPIYTISIAFAIKDDICMGLVLNPVNSELFAAIRGQGAHLNGSPIGVSSIKRARDSLLVTGFPYDLQDHFNTIIHRYAECLRAAQGIRRLGSAALDLCYVACGRFEGFWEQNLKPWDTAAGSLIAMEAGAAVTDFSNHPFTNGISREILATNGHIHKEMLSLLELKERQ